MAVSDEHGPLRGQRVSHASLRVAYPIGSHGQRRAPSSRLSKLRLCEWSAPPIASVALTKWLVVAQP